MVTKPIITLWCNDTIEDDIDNDTDLDETDRTGTVTLNNTKAVKLELENVDKNNFNEKKVNEVEIENNLASGEIENLKSVTIDDKPVEEAIKIAKVIDDKPAINNFENEVEIDDDVDEIISPFNDPDNELNSHLTDEEKQDLEDFNVAIQLELFRAKIDNDFPRQDFSQFIDVEEF